jgi:hypothetical protein
MTGQGTHGRGLSRGVAALCGPVLVLATAGCTMLDSNRIDQHSADECSSTLGHYFLPKRYLRVEVTQTPPAQPVLTLARGESYADPRYKYCLAFNGSPLAEDTIAVERYEAPTGRSRGLLKTVSSQAADKTKDVIEAALDTAVVGITGNPNLTERTAFAPRLKDFKLLSRAFDPFDWAELASVNGELADLGYCIKFDAPRAGEPGFVSGCGRSNSSVVKAEQDPWHPVAPLVQERHGIFYRPNLLRKFVVLFNNDRDGRGAWREVQNYSFLMPNEAPIFSVEVTRSLFITKKTTLAFSEGVLQDVTIDKPSELAGFVEIPLRVVEAVMEIPAQIVKVRINNTNNRTAIIAAQQKLLEVETQQHNLQAQLGAQQRTAQSVGVATPDRAATAASAQPAGGRFNDPLFRDVAEQECASHCGEPANQSRLANPATCPQVCVARAQRCLSASEQPTAEECFTLGKQQTIRQ